jgi:hypothetical protein
VDHFKNISTPSVDCHPDYSRFHDLIKRKSAELRRRKTLTSNPWNVDLTAAEIVPCLQSLKEGSATGPDKLRPGWLKTLSPILAEPLLIAFKHIWEGGSIPKLWYDSTITPIQKGRPLLTRKLPWNIRVKRPSKSL